jgi:hypothetical protein
MQKSKISRWSLKGSAAVLALAGAFTAAQAYETKFGEVSITFDTTVSMGASMLTQERNSQFLPEANGGPVDPRDNVSLGAIGATGSIAASTRATPVGFGGAPCAIALAGACGGTNIYTNNGQNFDGSINTDDGRLNFNRGDLIGANVKATHDLIVGYQNYKLFARGIGFYDVVMNDEDVGDHSQLTDQALGDVGRNYELLDLFVSADYTVAELPVNLRVGKQVINWGESTFIQNGLNVFNPIDVTAIRKPGSEIKEALVPVNSIFASVSFPFQVGLSGWYALDWEPFELDPSGTPFSTADSIASGSGIGGNNSYSFVTASPFGANRRNCSAGTQTGTKFVQTSGLLNNPLLGLVGPDANGLLECNDSDFVNSLVRLPNGQHELIRLGQINGSGGQANLSLDGVSEKTTGILLRGQDYQASDEGQFGIKATWFAEELNGTEFGFYYQNYHSRLPFVGIESAGSPVGDLTFNLNGTNTEITTGLTSRQLNNLGCGLTNPFLVGQINNAGLVIADNPLTPSVVDPVFGAGLTMAGAIGTAVPLPARTAMANTFVNDPGNVLPTAAAALAALSGGTFTLNATNGFKNQLAVAQLNCALTYYQSGFVSPDGTLGGTTVQTFDGAEFVLASKGAQVSLYYPEDLEVFGFSFNTTIGSWGVQAEATYRPNAPFQVDTDSLTIAALSNGCVFAMLYGAAGAVVEGLATPDGSGVKPFCGSGVTTSNPVIRNEMFTAQVGTTAQFTGSDWFIDAMGADIGTFVTEVGMVYTPGVEDTWLDNLPSRPTVSVPGVIYKDMVVQYQNTGCQGTDLPGGGILQLDAKSSSQCRPTNLSAGLVMLFTWSYNNFLDTGYSVSPRIVYSFDFEGTTAAPYGNYMEDRQALNLGIDGSLNNNFKVGVSYSNFFGGHVSNKSSDRDFASITASYSF